MEKEKMAIENRPPLLFKTPNEKPTLEELSKSKIAHDLGIAAELPKQTKRIFALYQLFSYYFFRSETKAYISLKIIEIADRLKERYRENMKLINEYVSSSRLENSDSFRKYVGFVNHKDLKEFREGEEQINFFKQLLYYYDQRKAGKIQLSAAVIKLNIAALKKIEEEAFECWLRLLDVNYELRNTMIGNENKRAIYQLSQKYVDLHTIIEQAREASLDDLEVIREEAVKEYYDIMRYFQLPSNKLLNFRLFLQKKLESRMYEAQFLKLQSGNALNYEMLSLDNNCKEFKRQYLLSLREITAVVNHYKEVIIRYQTFFSSELDKLVAFLQESYLNLINSIFKQLNECKSFLDGKSNKLSPEEIEVVIAFEKEKLSREIKALQAKYSSLLVPLVDSFDNELESIESTHCFNVEYAAKKYSTLQKLKNSTVEAFVDRFKAEKERIEKLALEKRRILENMDEKISEDVRLTVDQLREECGVLCADLLRENQYFWARFNAEFNSVSRKYFVRLYYEYSPYICSWKDGEEGWMHEYLKLKINSEYLKKIGSTVSEFSPEGKFHEKCSRWIASYANFFRNVCIKRDRVELDSLLKLNTVPRVDYSKVQEKLNKSLAGLEEYHTKCLNLVNSYLNRQ
ncbi:hypothetical protein [Candidatus Mycoplasma haematominutum]|uniref:Uncharacterized protein n=1 Tax=Candidatus Mycoplasma haematominutum 'Birmingham 1' TaxID=1116213 RepID=G8C3L5_9MOLU|nr:hypothetical protein [Candidatus Mycoplasma haematominutum]CCE66913.1 conserved haemoplasma hypothetical protein [Candidatus Mycoplasma haematominutum 'Birmingham 1']